jgi:predicted Zn-dependent protease
VIAAVLALPDVEPAPPAGPAGSSVRLPPDAAPPARPPAPGEPSGSGAEQAAQLVASARAEVAAGRLADARDLLSRAYTLDPQPATLLELASVDLQTGRCREARRAVQRVIADGAGALSSRAWELMGRIGRCD